MVLFKKKYSWKDRHVFITGGSEGCGYEVAKILLAKHDVRAITLFSRTATKLEKAKAELRKIAPSGAQINTISGDVSDAELVGTGLARARAASGPVDVVLCSAGMARTGYFEGLSARDFAESMGVNFFGAVNAARAYLIEETAGEDRKVIFVSSMAAAVPFVGYSAYAPSKAALRAFADVLRNEFADVPATGVHICFPPDMDTPGFAKENETKPKECGAVWPEAFNEVFGADRVAAGIVRDVSDGRYHLHSPDFFGNFIVSRGWGHYPRNFVLLEMVLAPLFVLFHEFMVWLADRCVLKHKHHGKNK